MSAEARTPREEPRENTRIEPGEVERGEIEIVEPRLVWENELVRLFDDRVAIAANGGGRTESTQFRLAHAADRGDGVVVVPVTRDHHILLLRQFRHPPRMWLRELPRGGREPGESPETAAARELREELGRDAETLHFLGRIATDSGQLEGVPHLFVAVVGERGETEREETEAIDRVFAYTYSELKRAAESGAIIDGFTLAALARLAPHFTGDAFRFRPELAPAPER